MLYTMISNPVPTNLLHGLAKERYILRGIIRTDEEVVIARVHELANCFQIEVDLISKPMSAKAETGSPSQWELAPFLLNIKRPMY